MPRLPTSTTATSADTVRNEAAARVLRQFRLVYNGVKSHFQQVERLAGVGGAQVWALSVIRDRPGIGVNELARAMDVRQPTASNLVRSLSEHALIDVRRDDRDRRAVQLRLLPGGARILRRTPGPLSGVLPESLAQLDLPTLRRLERDLGAVIAALGGPNIEDAAQVPLGEL